VAVGLKSIRAQEKHSSHYQAIKHMIARAARNALAYAESVMEASISLAVTGRGF